MQIRVQQQNGLWEEIDLPDRSEILTLDTGGCIFAGPLNHYFDRDGYYTGVGRSMEAMSGGQSIEEAEQQLRAIEDNRRQQDVLSADHVG